MNSVRQRRLTATDHIIFFPSGKSMAELKYALVLSMLTVGIVLAMFLWVVCKLFYEQMARRRMPRMDVDEEGNKPPEMSANKVRRDSVLTAALEEFHLRTLHHLIIQPLQAMSRVPVESHINFVSTNGGLRESTIDLTKLLKPEFGHSKVAPLLPSTPQNELYPIHEKY